MGNKKTVPAEIDKFLTEMYFIDKFNWLPQDVAKIPYKWMQTYFIINRHRNIAFETKQEVQNFHNKTT